MIFSEYIQEFQDVFCNAAKMGLNVDKKDNKEISTFSGIFYIC